MQGNPTIDHEFSDPATQAENGCAFRLRGLHAQVCDRKVLDGLDLDVAARRTTVILGPGGSGKSTLLRILAESADRADDLRLPIREGTGEFELPPPLLWDGECLCNEGAVRHMSQSPGLRQRLVIYEMATAWRLPHDLQGIESARSLAASIWRPVAGAWARLRPLMNKNFGDLTAGEQRLVDLTVLAAREPRCLLLDEPTAEQDLDEEDLVVSLLQSLRGHLSLVLVTHNLRVARRLADDLVLLIGGSIIESGPSRRLFSSPRHPRTEYFLRMGC